MCFKTVCPCINLKFAGKFTDLAIFSIDVLVKIDRDYFNQPSLKRQCHKRHNIDMLFVGIKHTVYL